MGYLIDTHVLIWITENSPKLPEKVKKIILDEKNPIYVSAISYWEIVLKLATGKLEIDGGLPAVRRLAEENKFITLQIEQDYLDLLLNMPFHHKDPFDRLLVATAQHEDITLITDDASINKYDLKTLW